LIGSYRHCTAMALIAAALLLCCGCIRADDAVAREPLPPLKLALIPVVETLPIYVAVEEGYFDAAGVEVEVVPVSSAVERDALLQSGRADGGISDLAATALFNKKEVQAIAVRLAGEAAPGHPNLSVMVPPGSDARSVGDLRGVPIAISRNTIIEYVTDRLLQRHGLDARDIRYTEVSRMPLRVELLLKGHVGAATLARPLSNLATVKGARTIVDDAGDADLSPVVVQFTRLAVTQKRRSVEAFLRAYERAVESLNSVPARYEDLMMEKGRVPDVLRGRFEVPPFPAASVPTPEQVSDIVRWLLEKGLIREELPYEAIVDGSLLPE